MFVLEKKEEYICKFVASRETIQKSYDAWNIFSNKKKTV